MSSPWDYLTAPEEEYIVRHYGGTSEKALAAAIGCSPQLVRQAVVTLARQGRIEMRPEVAAEPPPVTGSPPRRMVDAGTRWHIIQWFKRWGHDVEWRSVGGQHLPHLNGRRSDLATLCALWDSEWRREAVAARRPTSR